MCLLQLFCVEGFLTQKSLNQHVKKIPAGWKCKSHKRAVADHARKTHFVNSSTKVSFVLGCFEWLGYLGTSIPSKCK